MAAAAAEHGVAGATPVSLFQGYGKLRGTGLGTALTGTSQKVGGTSTVKYRVCLGKEEVYDTLEVEQSPTDEKLSFIRRQKLTPYSTCIVVYAKHPVGTETVTDVSLKKDVQPPINAAAAKDFVSHYGDSFMSSRTVGGEYYAVYTFYSGSWQQQTDLVGEMKAQGLLSPVRVDDSLQDKINNFSSAQHIRITFEQNVSGFDDPDLPSSDKIIKFAVKFPSVTLTAPVIIRFQSSGYEGVPGLDSTTFSQVSHNRDIILGSEIRASLLQLHRLQNDIASIKHIYQFYGGYDEDTKLTDVEIQAAADIKAIQAIIQAYSVDPFTTVPLPKLSSLAYGTPRLRTSSLQRSPNYGGNAGAPFCDINDDGLAHYLQQHTRISAVQMHSVEDISSLIVTYTGDNGSWNVSHGADGGDASSELLVPSGDFVNSMSGYYNEGVVTNLHFTLTNSQCASDGPCTGTGFHWKVPSGSIIVGFSGRHGPLLNAIQGVYTTFMPAYWDPPSPSSS